MTNTIKKTIIDPSSRRVIDEVKTTDDLYRDVAEFERQIKVENARRHEMVARTIAETGNELLKEVEIKHQTKEEERIGMIKKIYKLTGEKLITMQNANNLPIEDLKPYLIKAEEEGKPWYNKLLDFLMGWE